MREQLAGIRISQLDDSRQDVNRGTIAQSKPAPLPRCGTVTSRELKRFARSRAKPTCGSMFHGRLARTHGAGNWLEHCSQSLVLPIASS